MLVANDSVLKYLYRNKHDGTFEDVSYLSGFALNDEGREQAAMGIAVGDYNRDGKCFAVAMTRCPWIPLITDTAILDARKGSSPKYSKLRPFIGAR